MRKIMTEEERKYPNQSNGVPIRPILLQLIFSNHSENVLVLTETVAQYYKKIIERMSKKI